VVGAGSSGRVAARLLREPMRHIGKDEQLGRRLSGGRSAGSGHQSGAGSNSAVDIPGNATQVMRAETPQVSSGRTREPPASHCGLVSGQQGAAGFASRALVALFPMRQQPEFPVISVVSGCRKPAAEASR
jgi:hypothetical protein